MSDLISRQAAIDAIEQLDIPEDMCVFEILSHIELEIETLPSAQPELCEDAVPRTSVEYICRKNTVSTNPYEHKYHDKFIQFMDDPEISDFGRWQHSNGFNTALVAVKCDLDKVPSAQPERTCLNCGRTANNGGWYADGSTKCPIEEHYALPKDGFCHLWEKRNVTDDNYQERREG